LKKNNWYLLIGILFVVGVFFFSNSTGETLEEKDYIMALEFDCTESGNTVIFEYPVLEKDEAQSVLDNPQQKNVVNVEHFKDFVENYDSQNAKIPDLQHLKVLIIGKGLLNDEEKFNLFLKFLQEQNEFAENVYVAIDGSGGTLFGEDEESLGNYLETLISKKTQKQAQMSVTVGKLLSSVYNKNQALFIPVISDERNIIGEWVVACGKPVTFITEEEAQWYMTGNCIDCGHQIYFQDIYEEPIDENNNFSIEISRINREITFEGNGNKVYAHIQISIKGRARDNSGDLIEDSVEIYDKEQLMSECLTKKFQKMAQASQGKDLFNTYYELSTKNRKLWKAYQDNYSKYVQNLELKINVSLNCN